MLWTIALVVASSPLDEGWEETTRKHGVIVYTRKQDGSGVYESLGVGAIDAPPWLVKNAVDDIERVHDMPYLKESRLIKRDERGALIYHRTSPPIVSDRDYTIRMFDDTQALADGTVVFITRWRTSNDEGPPLRPNVVRVPLIEGYWKLEPIDGGTRTRASYFVVSDPGGSVPGAVAAFGSSSAVPEIFEAIRARVKDPKYRAGCDVVRLTPCTHDPVTP